MCLQEAFDLPGGDEVVFLTVAKIMEVMNARYMYFSPVFTFKFLNRKANFGNCIISKYPILEKETIFTYQNFIEELDYVEKPGANNMRNLQFVKIKILNNKVNVLNHHGYHVPDHKNGNEETIRQCRMIADYIASLDGPTILSGDFNLVPKSESIKQISKVLINLPQKARLKTTRTQLTSKTEVCDYIFVNDKVEVNKFSASNKLLSDHKALVLEFAV